MRISEDCRMIDLESSSRFNWTRLLRTMTCCILNIFTDGDSTVSQDSLLRLLNFKVKKCFSCVQIEFHPFYFVPISSNLVSGHYWEKSWCHFFILSCQVFIHNDEIPLEPSLLQLKSSSSLSLSSCAHPPNGLSGVVMYETK